MVMKRIINIMLTITLAAVSMQSFDTCAVSRTQRKQQRQELMRKRFAAQGRTPAGRRGIQARGRRTAPIQKKSPEIRKQNAQMEQQIAQNAKALEQATAQKEKATTPAQQQAATKEVKETTQKLLKSISQKRTWEKDIYNGYEQTEITQAQLFIKKLTDAKKKIEGKLKNKKEELAKVTSKGWIFNTPLWDAPVTGKETEYNKLTQEIRNLNDKLDKIDAALSDQAVIAGAWSNAYKALVGAGVLAAGATAANVALYGSTGIVGKTAIGAKAAIGTGLSSAASWAKEKSGGTWEWAKWVAEFGFTKAKALFVLYGAYTQYKRIYETAKDVYNKAYPNATEDERAKALAKEKTELDQKLKAFEDAEKQFKAEAQKGKK